MENLKENNDEIARLVMQVKSAATSKALTISTAESCTGGGLASCLTNTPGSSKFFDSSIVAYSNASKVKLLGVSPDTIRNHGAVSENVVKEMCFGLLDRTDSDIGVALSGIMGPDADGTSKDIGTVWLSVNAKRSRCITQMLKLEGDREFNKLNSILYALNYLSDFIDEV